MTDIQREAIRALAEVWELSPEVRLGQLMAHLGFLGEGHVGKGLGYIEDDEMVAVLYRHRAELEGRLERTTIDNKDELSDFRKSKGSRQDQVGGTGRQLIAVAELATAC